LGTYDPGGGAFALFLCPHHRAVVKVSVPTPRNLPSKVKKMLMPGGLAQGGMGTAGIDRCITRDEFQL